MLMVLKVSTNHIRKEVCHCSVIEIMQILTRQDIVITTFIHIFSFLILVNSEAWTFYHLCGIHYFLSPPYVAFIVSICKQRDTENISAFY